MANHPNRGKKTKHSNPNPEQVYALRTKYGLTQVKAAELWMVSEIAIRKWESGERRVHPLMWWAMNQILGEKL